MMFSAEKCADQSTGTSEAAELLTGASDGPGKKGVPPDEVASAVASVSQEIGDILKDELGDADRADRIGAQLENLSAELGMLAGLADHEPQQDFPSLFEIAMGSHTQSHRVSGSGTSSSSSWSGSARRPPRPQRTKRRPIAKGKEISRRRSAAARRAVSMRVHRVEVVSDASDVGAESDDSSGQWTELEDACSSDCSTSKQAAEAACNGYQEEQAEPEPPAMGQFLLPLLTEPADNERALLIRHEDILQAVRLAPLHLLTSNDDAVNDVPLEEEAPLEQTDSMSEEFEYEEPPVTPEEEAALLHYVCEAERLACSQEPEQFNAVEEWLLGVYHAWCEISALMYTLIGANMSVEMVRSDWVYRARFGCHCRLCLCLANNAEALARMLRPLLTALARGSETIPTAVALMRALSLSSAAEPCRYAAWQLANLKRHQVHETGLTIIHEHLLRLEAESELTREIVNKVCLCRPVEEPLQKENAMERLFKILENFKAASTITFKVDIVPPAGGGLGAAWAGVWRARLKRYLAPLQRCSTAARLRDMTRPAARDLSAWSGYQHRCDCLTPRTVCAQQRKLLLRISFFGMMQAVNEFNSSKEENAQAPFEPAEGELQQGDGTGAKPPDTTEGQPAIQAATESELARVSEHEHGDSDKSLGDLDDLSESDGGSGSLGLSSSSLDSASELLLAAAAAVESGSEDAAPNSLCRTIRHLMRSIASIERLMDRVLQHCDEWPTSPLCRSNEPPDDGNARKKVDVGLSEVDRKLMAVYRRLPEVHRRQLQVYRKQKKLSTVCMQLVGGRAPAPPPPGSPPPAPPHAAYRALCPEYHLQRFKEVRRKVMHMRDQQLYYHRLRLWLQDQLKNERERERDSMPESSVTLVEDAGRRKRRSGSPRPRAGAAAAAAAAAAPRRNPSRPHRILQMLKHKAPAHLLDLKHDDNNEVEPPEAFHLDKEDNVSDAETIVGEKETELCKEMKECLVKFANFALNSLDNSLQEYNVHEELPDSVSPPLQEMSPTTSEPMPVYTPKPSQRLLQVNKFLARDDTVDFQSQITPEVLNVPLNARRTPVLVEEEEKCIKLDDAKDPNVFKYVTFGLEIKKAMEECQNIINSYNSIHKEEGKEEQDGPLSLEQICEVMMSLDKNSAEFLEKIDSDEPICLNTANTKLAELVENMPQILANMPGIATKLCEFANASFELPEFASIVKGMPEVNNDAQHTTKISAEFLQKTDSDEPIDLNTANTKLAELVENMPHILANMPEIATKLSDFANASFELPEFASIMNSMPEVYKEAQLTPETLRQIRELKLNKSKDSVKVTKNTAKRKTRKIKSNLDHEDIIGTMTLEFDSQDITELLKDEKDLHALMKNKNNKEDFKISDLLFSISAQVVINKVFEYLKQNKSPELAKCLEDDINKEFNVPKNSINSEMYSKASTLFDNFVKGALSMDELRELVKARFNSMKHYVATKFKGIPVELLENEIEAMLEKFYTYIHDLAGKQNVSDSDKIIEKIEELNKGSQSESDSESCPASKESLKQISKLLSTSAGNTFDLLIMKLSKMSQDKKTSVKSLKFKYIDVIKRCADSAQLTGWILLNPEIASNVIEELTGIPGKSAENVPDFVAMPEEWKKEYFIERLKDMNKTYMDTLPKTALSGDEWLVMLYRLEKLEDKIKESFTKLTLPKSPAIQASEAEILAAKGLSKIIGKANSKVVKKPEPPKIKTEEKAESKETDEEKKCKNEALLAKCEAILTSKGEKSLLDSFYTIKSYITQGLPVPESYKKHVISICSSIDAKLLDDDIQETLKLDEDDKEKTDLSVIGSQNPELLAKYSAQALRNAKQTLNAVAFRNMMRNGQTKSESDACDTPKTDCKWTNDCICNSCKDSGSVCGDMRQCGEEGTGKADLDKKKDVKVVKPAVKAAVKPKVCENASHQQHVCKVGHSNVASACAGDGAAEQPCSCCYCTVFGHAPPLTTPVPRNYNETRERLRSILNKKKQKCRTANGEAAPAPPKPAAAAEAPRPAPAPAPAPKPVQAPPTPKPPALPKTLPPAGPPLTPAQASAQLRRQQPDVAAVTTKMADMSVQDKPTALQRTVPIQVNVPPALKTEGKVNPNAMEQIRLQQLKQQQQAAFQQRPQPQPQPQPAPAQKKPEPIYDLPIHNKPTLTPQQQQQIRQQQLQQQQQQQLQQQLQQQRQSRPAAQLVSLSSRDTSVFSTSSGCSGMTSHSGGCWRGAQQDPRDLDALLQYIEGPARHVDRGKKRAKKQRQKGKKLEARLLEEHTKIGNQLSRMRLELRAMQARHACLVRSAEEAKAQFKQQIKKKGKKQKVNPAQQAKIQMAAEQLGELNTVLNGYSKEMAEAERQVAEFSRRFEECERQLAAARALQGEPPRPAPPARPDPPAAPGPSGPAAHRQMEAAMLHKQQLQQQFQQQLQQQQLQQQFAAVQLAVNDKMDRQKQKAFINAAGVRRPMPDASAQLHEAVRQITVMHQQPEPPPIAEPPRKQTWEQALAHINQLAKGSNKEKKKQKEGEKKQAEPKPKEQQRSQSLPDSQPLSKKQRKLLAKQQAEEEERKRQQQLLKQETKSKKDNKKVEPTKPGPKKNQEAKKQEPAKKEDNKDKKKDKGKENKQEKAAPQPTPTAQQSKQSKKQKKEQNKPQVINITADTTIEVVSKKGSCNLEADSPSSCSIMEQLSCGVQVSDLRLPPGITLTRVQPNEKKEPAPIKSVPLWKAHALGAAPTPVARPAPVINADPAMMLFSTAQPEQPKTIIIPEPAPQPGRSKKAKKKAKKAAAAAAEADPKTDGTKMVTLRNPMFHPNLPPVANPVKKPEIRIPDPIPMPPNACQATITPTSNGMYTIRNPLMSMMHQQSLMGHQPAAMPMYGQQYNYVNPNNYTPVQTAPTHSPKQDEFQNRIMNLASFTQKNDEGYSLFKTSEDSQQKNFLTPEYYMENPTPKPVVSPNPIGTRPNNDLNRSFDSNDSSLFTNTVRPEPIGTPLKQENDYAGLYTPFGQEDRNVFRNALFNDKNVPSYGNYEDVAGHMVNGDPLPYFQRLRVGSKLNNEVTIHHVTESKFYKGQEGCGAEVRDESLFSRPAWPSVYPRPQPVGVSSPSLSGSGGGSGGGSPDDDARFGPVQRPHHA